MKKIYIGIVLFLLAFAVPVTVYSVITGRFDLRNRAAEEDSDNASAPQIVSVPVTDANIDEEYNYIVTAVDSDLVDMDALEYIIDQKPSWLDWNEERNMFTGTPGSGDLGSDTVSFKVSDGKWVATQSFTIVVEVAEVGEPSSSLDNLETPTSAERDNASQDEDKGEEPVVTQDIIVNQESISETTVEVGSGELVLGTTDELPQTSIGIVVGISLGFAVLVLALYLWLDSKHQFTERISRNLEYMIGRQTSFKLDEGLEVKRRKAVCVKDFDEPEDRL